MTRDCGPFKQWKQASQHSWVRQLVAEKNQDLFFHHPDKPGCLSRVVFCGWFCCKTLDEAFEIINRSRDGPGPVFSPTLPKRFMNWGGFWPCLWWNLTDIGFPLYYEDLPRWTKVSPDEFDEWLKSLGFTGRPETPPRQNLPRLVKPPIYHIPPAAKQIKVN